MREISAEFVHGFVGQPGGLRWQSAALSAIQEAAEAYLVHLFEDTFDPVTTVLSQKFMCDSRETRNDYAT